MASELTVQTIRGPLSGANANKILLASGQQIVAPAGGLVAPGQVIQVQYAYSSGTTSGIGTWVDSPVTISITPKFANSKILVMFDLPNMYMPTGTDILLRILSNGSVVTPARDDGNAYSNTFNMSGNRNQSSMKVLHSPNSVLTQTYTCQAYPSGGGGGNTLYMNYPSDRGIHTVVVMEIAQ